MCPVRAGLFYVIVFFVPALAGWLLGLVMTLGLLLIEPRLGVSSWLVMAVAELLWWKTTWAIVASKVAEKAPLSCACLFFLISLAMQLVPAFCLRKFSHVHKTVDQFHTKCPWCGARVVAGARTCWKCWKSIPTPPMRDPAPRDERA